MLNGKFYTGLPPKMIDRGCAGGPNRLESHLFWPDDSETQTAAERRIKRRNSVQTTIVERPFYEKQNSVIDVVDARKRFSKEFSQSSIQFYDNLNENNAHSRRSMLRNSATNKKMDITEKPTNTKLDLPDNVVNEAYTAAKKKQAYTSKIEFYDYANDNEEPATRRNNLRKPKMDMNDKREMELNSKNSPKLQVKRDVRSLSEEKEQHKINNREIRTIERTKPNKINDIKERREHILNNEENYLHSRRSVEPRMNVSPQRNWTKTNNNRYSCEREIYREPEPLPYDRYSPRFYQNSGYESGRYTTGDNEDFEDNSFHRLEREEPRRVIKNNTRNYYKAPQEGNYLQGSYEDEEITNRMLNVSLKSKQSQREYYPREENNENEPLHGQSDQHKTPTNRGSLYSRHEYNEREDNEVELPYKNYNYSSKRLANYKPPANKINNRIQRETMASPTSPPPSDAESSVSATKSQKHLRSSLCFNNGEIIGENDATTSPTSSHNPTHKRNARSSATQRVSVGLPD